MVNKPRSLTYPGRKKPRVTERLFRPVRQAWEFLQHGVWAPDLREMPLRRRAAYMVLRVVSVLVEAFRGRDLSIRAGALTYYTMLSIVPFLAMAFAMIKGLGIYRQFSRNIVQPYIESTYSGNPALIEAVNRVITFVDQTDASSLGVAGLVSLAYVSITMLGNVESTFNEIWHVRQGRSPLRKVTDYITLIVVVPLLIFVAVAGFSGAQSTAVVQFLRDKLQLGPLIDFFVQSVAWVVAFLAITALYVIMPNTRTKLTSVLLGGLVGGLLWDAVLFAQVKLQLGVARYNALYSGFAAFPIFLIWLWLSWLVVLVGAALAARHQQGFKRAAETAWIPSQRTRERIATGTVAEVARCFLAGEPRPDPDDLAIALAAPPPLVKDVAYTLVQAGILAPVAAGAREGEPGFVPGGDIDRLTLADVVRVMRSAPALDEEGEIPSARVPPAIARLLDELDDATRHAAEWATLRRLGELCEEGEKGEEVGERAA